MQCLYDVTAALQKDSITFLSVRYMSDRFVKELRTTAFRLSSDVAVIQDQEFENGLVKLQNEKAGKVVFADSCAVKVFPKPTSSETDNYSFYSEKPVVSHERKRQDRDILNSLDGYNDVEYVVMSSNVCDRFLSRWICS